jgi:hypothetical protein
MNHIVHVSSVVVLAVAALAACQGEVTATRSGASGSGATGSAPCSAAGGSGGGATAPTVLAHVPGQPTVLAVDCENLYVAPYEIGVVTAVSLADGSQKTLNPVSGNSLAMDATHVYSVSPSGGDEAQGLVLACPKAGCTPSYSTLATGQMNVWGVAVDSENVYWTNQGPPGAVMKAPLGGGAPTTLVGSGSATSIATAGGSVVFAGDVTTGSALLMSVPVDGGPARVMFTPDSGNSVVGLTVDSSNAYFGTTDGVIGQVPLAGGTAVTLATNQGGGLLQMAVNSRNLYWAANGNIVTVPIGGGATTTLATGQSNPVGVAVDAANVYWSNMGDGTVMKLALMQ